ADGMNEQAISQIVTYAGSDVVDIDLHDGVYRVEAYEPAGQRIELRLLAESGSMLPAGTDRRARGGAAGGWRRAATNGPTVRRNRPERGREMSMILKMIGQGLAMAAIVAVLAYGYQIYRADRLAGSFVSLQEDER